MRRARFFAWLCSRLSKRQKFCVVIDDSLALNDTLVLIVDISLSLSLSLSLLLLLNIAIIIRSNRHNNNNNNNNNNNRAISNAKRTNATCR